VLNLVKVIVLKLSILELDSRNCKCTQVLVMLDNRRWMA